MLKYYAIKQISTGWFLGSPKGFRRSKTGVLPKIFSPPRLFRREQDAKSSLKYYVEGEWAKKYDPETFIISEGIAPTPKTKRNKEDYKIVEIILTIKEG